MPLSATIKIFFWPTVRALQSRERFDASTRSGLNMVLSEILGMKENYVLVLFLGAPVTGPYPGTIFKK